MIALLKRYRELILVAVLLVVPLGVFFAHAKHPGDRSRLDRVVLAVTGPIEKGVGWAVTGTLLSGWQHYVALRGRPRPGGRALRREVGRLEMERHELLQARAENERLGAAARPPRAAPAARSSVHAIIGVRLDPKGLQLVTLDRGADDGVRRMMPVVTAQRRRRAGPHPSLGAPPTSSSSSDRNSSIAVRVERSRARANVRGHGAPGSCRLEYALRSDDLIEGDELVTSGTDGVFPRGLPVGKVRGCSAAATASTRRRRASPPWT